MTILAGHNCLITGASRGLGAEIAVTFWEAGANLILLARSGIGLRKLISTLPRRPSQSVALLEADLNDPTSPDRVAAEVFATFAKLDVLVNNAAIQGPIGPAWENDWAAWQTVFQINLFAPVALCRKCVPEMARRKRGKIINVSGGGATGPRARFSAYATSKAALVRFSETLAEETRVIGIDVNCVAPGPMNTDILGAVIDAGPGLAGQHEYDLAGETRQSGGASPRRAAELCLVLASATSDGITGRLISAVWDRWDKLQEHKSELERTDVYTLRRIVPNDRGLDWSL